VNFLKWVFGSKNDREVKKLWPLVRRINEMRRTAKLSDDELRRKADWKARLSQIQTTELAKAINEILPEAFAVVKNASVVSPKRRRKFIVREHSMLWE